MFEGNELIPHKEGRLVVAETSMWVMEWVDVKEAQRGLGKIMPKDEVVENVNLFLEALMVEIHRRINNHFRDKK